MTHISRSLLQTIKHNPSLQAPDEAVFSLPEKVLQFGSGVLLRGLPDFFIDKANRQGIFNGRVVIVKSTDAGDFSVFDRQDSLYTLCIRGIENGQVVEENIVCSAVSRVLSAKDHWQTILGCAENPDLQIILSNTTEVGIQLVQDDIHLSPPVSYPGKLLAFLYKRFKAFGGDRSAGLVIVPAELIPDNGKKLKAIVQEQAHRHGLEASFLEWLEEGNHFCSSLVDRIVPGRPDEQTVQELEQKFGFQDDLLTMAEVYKLWAIEGNEHVKSVLSFQQADPGMIIEPDIGLYRELKLRLLNGTHTLSCGLAFLAGFPTVREALEDASMEAFIRDLMLQELALAIPYETPGTMAQDFGQKVLDRFRNPHIEHHWLSITLQYTSKMQMRNVPTLLQYYRTFNRVPAYFAFGFAAYLLFMKVRKKEDGKYFGEHNGNPYPIKDDQAGYFFEKWQAHPPEEVVLTVLKNQELWGEDLTQLPGFAQSVTEKLLTLQEGQVKDTLQSFLERS